MVVNDNYLSKEKVTILQNKYHTQNISECLYFMIL